jgi:multidrug efflux pump subunit AcrA (membrane-fusion protein)
VDDAGVLRPGTFVRVTLRLEPLADRLIVPMDAVRLVEQGSIVVRALPPAAPAAGAPAGPPAGPAAGMPPTWKAEWVPVRVLGTVEGKAAVEPVGDAALAPGDRVVVIGVDRMFPGAPILPRNGGPAAPPGPAAAPGAKAP